MNNFAKKIIHSLFTLHDDNIDHDDGKPVNLLELPEKKAKATNTNTGVDYLSALPKDMILELFTLLTIEDLIALNQVSKVFNQYLSMTSNNIMICNNADALSNILVKEKRPQHIICEIKEPEKPKDEQQTIIEQLATLTKQIREFIAANERDDDHPPINASDSEEEDASYSSGIEEENAEEDEIKENAVSQNSSLSDRVASSIKGFAHLTASMLRLTNQLTETDVEKQNKVVEPTTRFGTYLELVKAYKTNEGYFRYQYKARNNTWEKLSLAIPITGGVLLAATFATSLGLYGGICPEITTYYNETVQDFKVSTSGYYYADKNVTSKRFINVCTKDQEQHIFAPLLGIALPVGVAMVLSSIYLCNKAQNARVQSYGKMNALREKSNLFFFPNAVNHALNDQERTNLKTRVNQIAWDKSNLLGLHRNARFFSVLNDDIKNPNAVVNTQGMGAVANGSGDANGIGNDTSSQAKTPCEDPNHAPAYLKG